MGKLKLNLVSGASLEKPLISAFTADGASYVVLDNEMNGSMGLPIILVSKLENGKLTKIESQDEWGKAKEYLKNIIAGNDISYITIGNEIPADDIYYTQLTLPVASFDALKNSYKVEEAPAVNNVENVLNDPVAIDMNTNNEQVVTPSFDNPVTPESPVVEGTNEIPVTPEFNISAPELSPMPEEVAPSISSVDPVVANEPVVANNNVDLENTVSFEDASVNLEPTITPTPVIETESYTKVEEDLFKEQKEAFIQACENMFDALVQKFKKELENK